MGRQETETGQSNMLSFVLLMNPTFDDFEREAVCVVSANLVCRPVGRRLLLSVAIGRKSRALARKHAATLAQASTSKRTPRTLQEALDEKKARLVFHISGHFEERDLYLKQR